MLIPMVCKAIPNKFNCVNLNGTQSTTTKAIKVIWWIWPRWNSMSRHNSVPFIWKLHSRYRFSWTKKSRLVPKVPNYLSDDIKIYFRLSKTSCEVSGWSRTVHKGRGLHWLRHKGGFQSCFGDSLFYQRTPPPLDPSLPIWFLIP